MTEITSSFIGDYMTECATIAAASLISGLHFIAISKPGMGKTELLTALSASVTGESLADIDNGESHSAILVKLSPSTPPESITGSYDPAELLNGRLTRVTDKTAYDPAARVIILDEVSRANDIVHDINLHLMTRRIDPTPVIWGTSNFTPAGDRAAALRDRFALWQWIPNNTRIDTRAIARAHLTALSGLSASLGLSLADIDSVRRMTPGNSASDAVIDVIDNLIRECSKPNEKIAIKIDINPRRIAQWVKLLFYNAAAVNGSDNFTVIPDSVLRLMKYAYPTQSESESREWGQVASLICDPIGSALDAVLAIALTEFKTVSEIKDPAALAAASVKLGGFLGSKQAELKTIGGNDPRVGKAIESMTQWFYSAVQGLPIESEGL
jgi:MoxR-like ATPase